MSVWKTHDEAEAANVSTADFVVENLADRIELQSRHVGDFLFDEGAEAESDITAWLGVHLHENQDFVRGSSS